MIYCPDCGSENRPEARFCRTCGFPFPGIESGEADLFAPEPQSFEENKLEPPDLSGAAVQDIVTAESGEPAPSALVAEVDEMPLPVDFVLNERYRIRKVIESSQVQIIYEAEDLRTCWSCRELQPIADAQFCQNCGAELAIAPLIRLRATRMQTDQDLSNQEGAFLAGGYQYSVIAEEPGAETQISPVPIHLASGFRSHPGGVRDNNEDSLISLQLSGICEKGCPTALGLFAVADGVGGSESGELASKAAIEGLAAHIMQQIFLPELLGSPLPNELLSAELKKSVAAANQSILNVQERIGNLEMGCTLTVALIRDNHAVIANVGDSRTYLMRAGHLDKVTQDHSLVARMVEQGVLQEEEVYSHQYRNVILRSLGFQPDPDVDLYELELSPGDRLLLCSDGLWETVRDPMIEDILLEQRNPQQTCDRLMELSASGDDNVSMIVVNINE